ncbi:hypothetical protein [Streptomyces sp. S1]|uniref:hypothetical protein n=1 Tax=Streptomyces sp. S1 TaxID=718288 RepID=UPI003D74C0C9
MAPDTHVVLGTHPQHGYVAAAPNLPTHLADWYLDHLQFEPVAGEPGLYRLTEPDRDGPRRMRQTAQALRRQGYGVHVDADVEHAPDASPPALGTAGLTERRSRVARAAAARSPQYGPAPTTTLPSARPVPPRPAYAPTVHLTAAGRGR